MSTKVLPLPSHELRQRHVCKALSRYWSNRSINPAMLPIVVAQPGAIGGPLKLQSITLPDWASDHGVQGAILVPEEACTGDDDWLAVDWWLAAFLLLECWHERAWELNHGPIHSYSFRLKGWDTRAWDHAWVNRIALFMRSWGARTQAKGADELFGALPNAEALMTHDVDAIEKTLPIRLKQGVFNLCNAIRYLGKGEVRQAIKKLADAMRFLFHREDWWTFDALLEQEKRAGVHAQFNFYADNRRKTFRRWLFDPGYDVHAQCVQNLLQRIQNDNGIIGLHPTFDAWGDSQLIRRQKELLSSVANRAVTTCRQHWLRFSWSDTWAAQEDAGIQSDSTLMFNDRPGYRASAALAWQPWRQNQDQAHRLTELPTAMMDSHLYDYGSLNEAERIAEIHHWIDEVGAVRGQIAILWHPHTLAQGYGWSQGCQHTLNALGEIESYPHLQ